MEHSRRVDAGQAEAGEAGARLEAEAVAGGFAGDEDGCGAVDDLGGVPCRDDAVRAKRRRERGERLGGRVPARRLVDREDRRRGDRAPFTS